MKDLKRISSFFILPLAVYIFDWIFIVPSGFYSAYSWIDIPMHFIGGLAIGYSFVLLFNFFQEKKLIKIKSKLLFIFLVVSSVAFVAVLWEFYEFFFYVLGIFEIQTLRDTLLDLFFGIFGGLIISLFRIKVKK